MLSGALDQQGVLFNKMQKNITSGISNRTGYQSVRIPPNRKEGFTDKILNKKYTDVTADYTQLQTELQDNNLDILKRLDPKTNAALGKNIALNDSSSNKGYVTDQGIFKAYNPSTWLNTPGKFGCPGPDKIIKVPVNESDQLNASTPGYTFTTENFPKLLVGQPMQSGAACGGAGKNVYVDRLVDKPTASYVGCFKESSAFKSLGPMDYSNCLSSAMSSDNAYFGLTTTTDANNINQTNCMVSNVFGDDELAAVALKPVLVWESATKNKDSSNGNNCCTVTTEGILTVSDAAVPTNVLFQSNDAVPSCVAGGGINHLVATFGGNCADKYSVETGNATKAVMSAYDKAVGNSSSFSFLVNDKNIGLSANDCTNKAWDASYQCGNVSKVEHMGNAGGKNAKFNCDAEVATCTFAFTLNNNGKACLFQTKNGEHAGKVWCMATKSEDGLPKNAEFAAAKGKTGTNSLNNGQTLFAGEWIGSNNGALRLVMQTDGNLCLYSYVAVETCAKKNGSDFFTGVNADVNAVYKVDNMGNKSVLNKMGYVDQDDVLHNYAADAIAYSDTYTLLPNTNIQENNLGDPISNSTVDACKTACSANTACGGYAFESGANVCYLKNGDATNNQVTKQGTTSGIRLPQVLQKKSCAADTVNISSEKYDRYVKGEELSDANMGSICNPFSSNPVSETTKVQYAAVNEDLAALGSGIMGGINRFSENIGQSQREFAKTGKKMMKSVQSYKDVYKKTHGSSPSLNVNGHMLNEGMRNMQDLGRMKSDSELIVTHQNMRYIYWMLAALGLITVCMAVANKKR